MKINRVLRGVIISGLFALLLTPLFVSNTLFFPFITGKAFFFRIVTEIIFGLWLFLIWRSPTYRPKKSWITITIILLTVTATLATIFSQNPYHSFWSNFERMDGLISYLHLLAYFLIISSVFRSEKVWQWFFHSSVAVSLIVGGYAVAQLIGQIPISQGRLDATLGNAIYLAVYMIFHAFLTTFLLIKNQKPTWLRYLYTPAIIFQIYILYKTATRGAILGLLAGVIVFALILLFKLWSDRRARLWSIGLLTGVVLITGSFWLARNSDFVRTSPVLSRFADISPTETTTESRLTIWQMSLRGFQEHPVLGWGPENYGIIFNKYYEPKLWRQEQWFDRSHNIFLDWLIDAGLLGLLAYLGLFLAALYELWRQRSTKHHSIVIPALFTGLLAGYLVNNLFVFDNLTSYLLFLSVLAYFHHRSLGTDIVTVEGKPLNDGNKILQVIVGVVLVGALGTCFYYVNWKPLTVAHNLVTGISPAPSDIDPNQAVKIRMAIFRNIFDVNTFGSREAAEQLFNQATSIVADPKISAELKQSFATLAVSQMKKEVKLMPADTRGNLILGTMLGNFGQTKEALTFLNRAVESAPRKQTTMFSLAGLKLTSGDKKGALVIAEQAFKLDENFPEARRFYALTLIYNQDLKKAETLLAADKDFELDDRFINAYVFANRYDLVLKLWQERVAKNPADAQMRFSLAASYLTTGDRQNAIKELQSAKEINPQLTKQVEYLIAEIRAGRNPVSK